MPLAPPSAPAAPAVAWAAAQAAATRYARATQAPATRRAYQTDWAAFTAWAAAHGQRPYPAAPASVAAYAAACADAGRSVATIQRRVAAIAHAHRTAGVVPPPTQDPLVRATLVGIRRLRGAAPAQTRPLTLPALRQCLDATAPATRAGARDRALLLLGFAGGFRRSELVGLDVADVTPTPAGLQVRVQRSKTDQEGRGREVGIPVGAHPATCPVRALQAWQAQAGITAGPLFRPVDRWDRVGPGRLAGRAVARVVQRGARRAGLDPRGLAGHSLRAGLATAAAAAGASERTIMAQTGHRSVAMVRRYIRRGSLFDGNAAAQVGL